MGAITIGVAHLRGRRMLYESVLFVKLGVKSGLMVEDRKGCCKKFVGVSEWNGKGDKVYKTDKRG